MIDDNLVSLMEAVDAAIANLSIHPRDRRKYISSLVLGYMRHYRDRYGNLPASSHFGEHIRGYVSSRHYGSPMSYQQQLRRVMRSDIMDTLPEQREYLRKH